MIHYVKTFAKSKKKAKTILLLSSSLNTNTNVPTSKLFETSCHFDIILTNNLNNAVNFVKNCTFNHSISLFIQTTNLNKMDIMLHTTNESIIFLF